MADKVKVNIYMSPEMLAALKKLAAYQDRPYAELVRMACKDFILANAAKITADRKAIDQVSLP